MAAIGCGGGTATPAQTPEGPAPAPTAALSADDDGVIEKLTTMLDAAKLECGPSLTDPEVGVCAADKETVPATHYTYSKPAVFFVSHLRRRDDGPCDKLLPTVNDVNASVERVKVICLENRLTLTSMLVVPTGGLSQEDVQEFAKTFRVVVQGVKKAEGLADALAP